MAANRALIANQEFLGQRVRGTYFFAGNWRYAPDGIHVHQFYEFPVGPNDQLYTVHPIDPRHLGWSEIVDNRIFALDAMVADGVNTVVMSYWGEPGTDRWARSAPMQTSTQAHDQLFDVALAKPLLIMPAIESALASFQVGGNSQSYNFSQDFPGTPSNPAPALVTQVLDLISRYLQNPTNPQWPTKWLQMFDRDGIPRFAINLLHVASSQIPGNADDVFAAGFQWVDDLVFARTGIRVGFTLDALPTGQTIPTPVGDRGGWVPWFSIPGQTFPGATISALWAPADSQHLDLFAVSNGAAITTWWDGAQSGYNPAGWQQIHPEMRFDPPAAISALWAPGDDTPHLDLFAVNADGLVATIWWEPDGYRSDGWILIDPSIHFQPGAQVAAVWANNDHLDLFAIDADGIVRTTWWDKSAPSGYSPDGWMAIHPEAKSVAGGHVTAVWANSDHLDLFIVTADFFVCTIWWDRDQGYRPEGWVSIGPDHNFFPGAKVSALWAPRADFQHLDLFTTDRNGLVSSIWWDSQSGGYRPEGWFTLSLPGLSSPPGTSVEFPPGAYISAIWAYGPTDPPNPELFLFACSTTGTVLVADWGQRWTPDQGLVWINWLPVGPTFQAVPGSKISAVVSPDPNHIDLFATDPNGGVHSTYYRFIVKDTYVANAGSAGPWLEKTPAVLAIQGFIPEIYADASSDDDRFQQKNNYWSSWLATGLPVFWDVSPGYDAHVVFPGVTPWGNDASWRIYIQESWSDSFRGMVYNTWNGYTEGYCAMATLEYGDIPANWAQTLFQKAL
jgi:hypothetical protein